MRNSSYLPVFELTRGEVVESVHFGAISVVDRTGSIIASYGDPNTVTYLRSTAKPLQAIPFLEHGGLEQFGLTLREVALICASHVGTDEHMTVLRSLQSKVDVDESELLCGTHPIRHKPTRETMRARGEEPTPNRHNCSGKHTGMLAYRNLLKLSGVHSQLPYVSVEHPVQKDILKAVAEMCDLTPEEIKIGIDGCSAPNFAVPLYSAALAFARLCDPSGLEEKRAAACRTITEAMTFHPDMIGGPGSFDTCLMDTASGRIISKGGAEAYLGLGLMPGAIGIDSPSLGITLKISDGDLRGRAKPAIALEVLRQLNVINSKELELLGEFGPTGIVKNWRDVEIGVSRPNFKLVRYM